VAEALRVIAKGVKGISLIDEISAVGGGILDGILIDTLPIAFLAKNILIPVLAHVAPVPIPDGLVHQSEGMLGFTVYLMLKPKR